ncbi:bifunctional polysaccharide deacetylase/glycosyltransferase family 2 protein [Catelliglobosispora koreensis]|uniref:bifunctional polysaccharide deacetylase/glycosyltransferase family 2 protein n=1 Tax=Catelliglobosispora koreensis TaxID=129052 RepID=UPI000371D251|nr:bifunctional polysaccharide deacetylase/glycosyltransferase family 2 protein [Catelliglobosispora koreensis]
MSHRLVRQPRAHWILLLLGLVVLLGLLMLGGYSSGVLGGSGRDQPAGDMQADRVPEEALKAGPVIRLDGPTVRSLSMPEKTIALTFDDGPDPQWTPQILDILAKYDAKATFFVIGANVNEEPELTRRIADEGHELGSHTFTHAELAVTSAWQRQLEITLTGNAIAGATGLQTNLFRPPFSSSADALTNGDFETLQEIAQLGYVAVLSDVDTKDWKRPGTDAIVKAGTPEVVAGAVVLMHDGGGDRSQTVAALDVMLPALKAKGYRFETVSKAAGAPSAMTPAPTAQQWRGKTLRWAQVVASAVATGMTWLLGIALSLAVLRLVVQLITVRLHRKRVKRRWSYRRYEVLVPVSVIVPAYNEAANIAATVRSLVASDYPYLEVIVVDDGSSDGTADIVRRLRLPDVFVIQQANAGKPAALNTGMRAARGELFVLVDGDTVFQPDTVYNLVQGFADPRVGAIAGNTKVANRKGFLGRWQHLEYVIGFNLDRRFYDVAGCMPTIPGAIGAFRAEVMNDVAGVPGDTLAEDTDLTMAVIRAGWKVTYEEHAIAWTEAPSTLRQLWRQRYRWCYGTMQAMWKHRRAVGERNRLKIGLTYLALFQVALPLTAPAVDIFAVYGLLFLTWQQIAVFWIGLLALQGFAAAVALKLDREKLGPLVSIAFQQIVYRQLMYLVVVQSVVTALIGSRLGWHRMARTGSAAALMSHDEHDRPLARN